MPERIRLSRKSGFRLPPGAKSVARPTRWGNPYIVGTPMVTLDGIDPNGERGPLTAAEAVEMYRESIEFWSEDRKRECVTELRGHDLACWCPLEDEHGKPYPCHANYLLVLANE